MPTFDRSYRQGECPNPLCRTPIVLPHQSPSKMFPDQLDQFTDKPSATFLCTKCGHMFECSPETFPARHIDMRNPDPPVSLLWKIEFECVHENCGKQKPIFFAYDANASDFATQQKVLAFEIQVSCNRGHRQTLNRTMLTMFPAAKQKPWP